MEDLKRLKDIATQFFSEISPREITDLDRLFEQWKSGVHKKQEVNFGLALPPSMRDQVLRDIGFGEPEAEPAQEKYLGYLNLLNRMMEMNLEALLDMSPEELSAFIWKEGKRLGLRESEIRDLGTILPPWIQKISNKAKIGRAHV